MKLACQEHHIPGRNLIERWEFITAAGFDAIELRSYQHTPFRERLPELKAAREAGVDFPTVCPEAAHFLGDFDADRRRDAIDQMKMLLSVMGEVGGFAATTPAAWGMFSRRLPPFEPPRSPEDDRAVLIEGMGILGEHAQREGVKILLEPLNRYEDHMVNTLAHAIDICDAVGLDSVGVVGDMFHMNIEEDDPLQTLRVAGRRLVHMQIGDSNRLQPGAGHLDFVEWIATLKEIGYDGYLTMECRLRGEPTDVLPAVAGLMRPILRKLDAEG